MRRIGMPIANETNGIDSIHRYESGRNAVSGYYDLLHFLGSTLPSFERAKTKSDEINRLDRAKVSTARSFSSCLSDRYLITVPRRRSLYI
jgi:hypothetical protein